MAQLIGGGCETMNLCMGSFRLSGQIEALSELNVHVK